jgi:hypothetical protein
MSFGFWVILGEDCHSSGKISPFVFIKPVQISVSSFGMARSSKNYRQSLSFAEN